MLNAEKQVFLIFLFCFSNNLFPVGKSRKNIPLIIASLKIKYAGMYLTKVNDFSKQISTY